MATNIPSIYWQLWAGMLPEPFTAASSQEFILDDEETVLHKFIGSLAILLDQANESIESQRDEWFVATSVDELAYYEGICGLVQNPSGFTTEQRRALIISSMQAIGITIAAMKKVIFNITGADCTIVERFYDVRSASIAVENQFIWDVWVLEPGVAPLAYTEADLERILDIVKPEPTDYVINYVATLPTSPMIWDIDQWNEESWGA